MNSNNSFFSNLKSDVPASIVVFLVALPLCLGIALASGAPLFSGIISGIVGGIIVAILSGSPLGVSGPAAGLAVIVLTAIQDLGAFDAFLLAVVFAGVIQIMLGIAKAGIIGYYFPSSVIKGMLSGIGIIIILKQIPHAFGYDAVPEGYEAFQQVDGQNTFSELVNMLNFVSPGAIVIAVLSLAILIMWETSFMKRLSFTKLVQGPLVVVTVGVVLNIVFSGMPEFALSTSQVVNIPVAASFSDFLGQFTFPDFSQISNPDIYIIGATMAVVASLETLLCVEATDKLDPQKRVTPTNRELIAQGVGNMASGMIGGLPVTQVIVRSSANIQSGGKTKVSAIIHGVFLLITAFSIPAILNLIPLASLAAILFMVGYKLAKPAIFKEVYRKGLDQFIPFMVTILGIIFTDLLVCIMMVMVVAIMNLLWNNFKTPYHFDPDNYDKSKPIRIDLAEEVSFLNKASILHTLDQMPENTHVVIDATKTKYIHPDIIEVFEDFSEHAKTVNIEFEVVGLFNTPKFDPTQEIKKILNPESASKKRNHINEIFNS